MDSEHTSGSGTLLSNGRVIRATTLVLFLLAAFLLVATLAGLKEYRFIGSNIAPVNVVSVAGEGEVFAVPDTATFTFTLMQDGETAAAVQEAVSAKADAIVAALKERGIEERDIKTVGYNLFPKYEWEPAVCYRIPCERNQVQKGFTLNQSVEVKVRNIDQAGELLGLVSELEASSVSGISFTVDDEEALKAEARKAAIDDAKAKAEKLAADLGVSLVRIVNFSEHEGYYPMPYMARAMDMQEGLGGSMEVAATVPAGENRIGSNVTIVYEIR